MFAVAVTQRARTGAHTLTMERRSRICGRNSLMGRRLHCIDGGAVSAARGFRYVNQLPKFQPGGRFNKLALCRAPLRSTSPSLYPSRQQQYIRVEITTRRPDESTLLVYICICRMDHKAVQPLPIIKSPSLSFLAHSSQQPPPVAATASDPMTSLAETKVQNPITEHKT